MSHDEIKRLAAQLLDARKRINHALKAETNFEGVSLTLLFYAATEAKKVADLMDLMH